MTSLPTCPVATLGVWWRQWEQLCQWLASSGAVGFDHDSRTVTPRAFEMPGGETISGLAALRDLRVGDVLLSIPTYCALIAEEVR